MIDLVRALQASIPVELQQAMDEAERGGAVSGLYMLLLHGDYETFDRVMAQEGRTNEPR